MNLGYFRLGWSNLIKFNPVWSILDRSDQKMNQKNPALFILFVVNVTTFYGNIFWLVRNPIWSSLIHFGQIWSKKIKNKTAIFIPSVNVTTFYSNIFRLVRKSNLIKFDPFWTDLIQNNQKQNSHFYPLWKCDNFS